MPKKHRQNRQNRKRNQKKKQNHKAQTAPFYDHAIENWHIADTVLSAGDIAMITGLSNRKKLNNQLAVISAYGLGDDHDRYKVFIASEKKQNEALPILIKPCNWGHPI